MATDKEKNFGLYSVCAIAGKEGTPGAPLLHLNLLVHTPTGKITGQGTITQAIAPPNDTTHISNITGKLRHTGLGKYTQIVSLQGYSERVFTPPAIGTALVPFDAHFATDSHWNGVGGWTLGGTSVDEVPVKKVECPIG